MSFPSEPADQRKRHERELSVLDAAIERGMADIRAGRVFDAEDVFAELRNELERLGQTSKG